MKHQPKRPHVQVGRGPDPDQNEKFKSCPYWSYWRNEESGQTYKRACGRCFHCNNFKRERIVGQAMAQSELSAVVMSMTLTYENNPDGSEPDGAIRLDYEHMKLFYATLRKRGYRFKKIAVGEYGGKKGRAHWHVVLFFEWDPVTTAKIIRQIEENASVDIVGDYLTRCPRFIVNYSSSRWVDMVRDPDLLVCTLPQAKGKNVVVRNAPMWFWPHGEVACQIVKAPFLADSNAVEGGTRYATKYVVADAWRDKNKYKNTPFDELPEHIKQQTRYGPWLTAQEIEAEYDEQLLRREVKPVFTGHKATGHDHRKWRLGNDYVKELEAKLLEDFPNDAADVPLDRRIMRTQHYYKSVPSLGSAYFKALGVWYAFNGSENQVDRSFKVGSNYVSAPHQRLRAQLERGEVPPDLLRRFPYLMPDSSFRAFWAGFNDGLIRQGMPPTTGKDNVLDNLETSAAKALASSSGPLGYQLWNKNDRAGRELLELHWSDLPNDRLSGLIPTSLRKLLEDTSEWLGWREKGLQRAVTEIERAHKRGHLVSSDSYNSLAERASKLEHTLMLKSSQNVDDKRKGEAWSLIRRARSCLPSSY